MVDADDHLFTNPAIGVEISVEVRDVPHGIVHVVGEVDEVEISLGNESVGEKIICDESAPGLPIMAIRAVHHHDRNDRHFSSLHEGEDFKTLVVRSKSAWEKGEGTSLLREVQLAGEKIIEVDELRVAVNGRIGGLLERKPDIESKAFFGASSRLSRPHDTIATACNKHVTGFDNSFPEGESLRILGLRGFRAGAAENGYLADAVVAGEDVCSGPHFAQGTTHEFEFPDGGMIPTKAKYRVEHLLDITGGFPLGDFGGKGANALVSFFFVHEKSDFRVELRPFRANAKKESRMISYPRCQIFGKAHSLCVVAALCWVGICAQAQAMEISIPAGGTFDPFLLALKPGIQMSPLPTWMEGPATINPELGTVEIAIAPLWKEPAVEMYAVTVVFNDNGDGGPSLNWKKDGELSAISYAMGEVGNAVGLNSRTVLLPQALTKDGGSLQISCEGSFDSLLSLAVRPARQDQTAVLGARRTAALIDDSFQVLDDREVSGSQRVPMAGDVRAGTIVEAELSSAVEPLQSAIEFVTPVEGNVEGATIHLEALGLDLEAELQVSINSKSIGQISFPTFALDDPSLVTDWNGRLIFAGWRKGALFIPARHFTQGENSLSISLKRSEGETGRDIFLRNTSLHLRFTPPAFTPLPEQKIENRSAEFQFKETPQAVDFQSLDPIIPHIPDEQLPEEQP